MRLFKKFYFLALVLLMLSLFVFGCDSKEDDKIKDITTDEIKKDTTTMINLNLTCPGTCKTTCLPNEKKILCLKPESVCENEKKCCVELKFNCSKLQKYDADGDFSLDSCSENCVDMIKKPTCSNDSNCINGYKCCDGNCIKNSTICCGDKRCEQTESCTTCTKDCGKCEGQSCVNAADCNSKFCVHGFCRPLKYYCGDNFCDWNQTENYTNCPTDCCYNDCSSADNLCHAECDKVNGCDFFVGCDKKKKNLFNLCENTKTVIQCCQGITKECDLDSYCNGGNCSTCSRVCDGRCQNPACCGTDPDCNLFGKPKGCTNQTSGNCINGIIEPLYTGYCAARNKISLYRENEGTRVLKDCCNGLFCDETKQGCFDADSSKELCERWGYTWKGENCTEISRCCGDDCFPTNCDYTCG